MHAFSRRRALRRSADLREEIRLVDDDENIQSWEDAYHRIRVEVSLAAPDGHLVPEFLLHIDGSEAWWRWTDEPFEDEGGSVTRDGP